MKQQPPTDVQQAGFRLAPKDWMCDPRGAQETDTSRAQRPQAHKWLTILPAPIAEVREATMHALNDVNAVLAYLYEAEAKVVIRSTLPQRQIRAELTPIDPTTTRIVVVTMKGDDVDRLTSSHIVGATEQELADKGFAAIERASER